jgi:TonB family protein
MIYGGILNGKAMSLPKPYYPNSALSSRVSGIVTVGVTINEKGKIVLAGAQNGHPYLQDPSRDAACKAKFTPTYVNGEPVRVQGVITYAFFAR